jgi:nitrite reductase/ring-hydroxylating ferredoxin subunit
MTRRLPIPATALTPDERAMVWADSLGIAVFNVDGQLHAIDDSCPHAGASLFSGRLDGHFVRCRAHGMRVDLTSGKLASGGLCVRRYAIEQDGDTLAVVVPDSSDQ